MNILITGAKGMVGRALVNNLKNIRDGKNRTRPNISIGEIYEYDVDSTTEQLDEYCEKAEFVFNLAGVNRPKDPKEFMEGNFGFANELIKALKKHNNKAPIMLSSSIQATLSGRFANSEYGISKKAGEELFYKYSEEEGVSVFVYRFPNLMGRSRPNYNSAVSTFCWAIANDKEYTVNDRSVQLELLYIDDLIEGMLDNDIVNFFANMYIGFSGEVEETTTEEPTVITTTEAPTTVVTTKTPDTGDTSAVFAAIATLTVASAAAFVCLKKKED